MVTQPGVHHNQVLKTQPLNQLLSKSTQSRWMQTERRSGEQQPQKGHPIAELCLSRVWGSGWSPTYMLNFTPTFNLVSSQLPFHSLSCHCTHTHHVSGKESRAESPKADWGREGSAHCAFTHPFYKHYWSLLGDWRFSSGFIKGARWGLASFWVDMWLSERLCAWFLVINYE